MRRAPGKLFLLLTVVALSYGSQPNNTLALQSQTSKAASGLVESARTGDLVALEALLAAGADPNARDQARDTALVAAAFMGNEDAVELLLNKGARVDERSLGGHAVWVDIGFGFFQRPMPSYSFRCGNSILEMSAAYSKADTVGVTALMAAASQGRVRVVRRLLNLGADVHVETFAGVPPLVLATIANNVEIIRMLLLKGADVNAAAGKGQTALMIASWSDPGAAGARRMEAIRLLVDAGANVDARDEEGRTALLGAAEADNLEAARYLLNKGADVNARTKSGRTALIEAAHAGNVEMLRLLSSRGADLEAKDLRGAFAVREAASLYRKPEAVAVLLEAAAGAEATAAERSEAALLAAELAHADDASRLLKQAGAMLGSGRELALAAYRGDVEKVRTLLAAGADPNTRGIRGKPVLQYAAHIDNPVVVKLLIERGADINLRNRHGETALIAAAFEDSPKVAKLLMEMGADVNAKSDSGMTALMNAAWRGQVELVRLLIESGADVTAQTASGITALEMSQYAGDRNAKIARILQEAGARR